jgi:hypothetical protein
VWDEQANPAVGTSSAAQGVAQGQDGRRRIALALETTLAQLGVVDGVNLVIEDVPHDIRLSAGRCNGNEAWSIGAGELDKLHAVVPSARSSAFTLRVRVLRPDPHGYAYASTVAQFEIVVERDLAWATGLPKRTTNTTDVAAPLGDAVAAGATGSRALAVIVDPAAEDDWRTAAERRLTAARQAWHPDDALSVARMHAEWEAAEQERRAARDAAVRCYQEATLAQLEEQQRQRQAARATMAETLKSARLAARERAKETALLPPAPQVSSPPRQAARGWMIAWLAAGVGLGCAVLAVWPF